MEKNSEIIKICFVGIGSIAKRHIINIYKLFEKMKKRVIIDAYRSGKGKDNDFMWQEYVRNIYVKYDDISDIYDVIFITNPTQEHYDTLKQFQNKGKAFFIEKPVFSTSFVDVRCLNIDSKKKYYVACPLRYNKVIQYLRENVNFSKIYSVRAISSSYLPEWRTGIDYRNTYSAHKDMGGGVSIDLIHEWDYLTYLLGMPEEVMHLKGQLSELEIDSDDVAIYIAKYPNKVLELHLDYFGKKPIRQLMLFGETDTIVCDLLKNTITFLKEDKVIAFRQERDDYQMKELEYFFDLLHTEEKSQNDIYHACKVLNLAEGN